ncbi:MAG: hypothetical protein JNM07_04240 [Phycisphaerae bacterium]|nr:hypothetical protein [Phycisphaerae bacterium]
MKSASTAMRTLVGTVLALAMLGASARADVAYAQPPDPAGGQYKSAWYAPDGLDDDAYVWDAFALASNTAITEVHWRGAYTNYLSGAGKAPVYDFTVSIYASIAGGSQPDVTHPPLIRHHTNGNAGETPAGSAGGVAMYDYRFTLPAPFQAVAGTKYWIQIEAYQGLTPTYYWPPDWSIARGTGGDGSHFRRIGGSGGMYQSISGDCAFTLMKAAGSSFTIGASASPAAAGTITGAGAYPSGSVATLTATANAGYGFSSWTEGGTRVSANRVYSFTVTQDRTLVANFVPAYTITTITLPSYGGTATGGGTFNEGASVTVTAAANPGFAFAGWTWYGLPVSAASVYTFPASADLVLTAEFVHDPLSTTFTFDDAPPYTSLPVSLAFDGLAAHLSATGSGFSIQHADALGFTPAGFGGLCVYPNSVFPADLIADFSEPLTFFSIMYAPQELGCDDSARMRVTVYLGGVQAGTATAAAPVPGTWPTGTLSISAPGGFDRAVVHYDARPPTCQDYGVIFLADNMTVTRACVAAGISDQPAPATTCPVGGAAFTVGATGAGALTHRWQREAAPGVFADLADGPTGSWDGGAPGVGAVVSGSGSGTLRIDADIANARRLAAVHAVRYRCVVNNACGAAASVPAPLTVCPADFNCDGGVDDFDYFDFLNAFFASGPAADFNGDTSVDDFDFFDFLNALGAGC